MAFSTLSYAQEFNTQFGSVKYKINPDNTITYLGSTLNYKFKDFAFANSTSNSLNTQSLSYSNKNLSANFSRTYGSSNSFVSSLKFGDFSIVDQQLVNNRVQSFSYLRNNISLDYISAENPIAFKDYWNRNITSKTYYAVNFEHFRGKMLDNYYNVGFNFGAVNLQRAYSNTQSENNLQYKDKQISVKLSNFDNTKYQKDFIDVSYQGYNFKSASDANLNAQMLTFGNTTIAHNQTQNYVQSKSGDVTFKVAQNKDDIDYSVNYKGLSYNDKQWFYTASPNKNLSLQIGSDSKIHNVNFNSKLGNTNLSLKYTDKFDVYDFYFNQNIFSIYDNNFNMIGNSKTQYKEATNLSLSNSNYVFNFDAINDLWNLSFKANKELGVGYLRDQKQNYLNVTDNSKYGNFMAGYNFNTSRLDKLQVSMNWKF